MEEIFGDKPVTIYGEGISKDYNVHYGFPDGNFIMYDIQGANGTYFNREIVYDVAQKLCITCPWGKPMTMKEAVRKVMERPQSELNPEFKSAEMSASALSRNDYICGSA